MAVYHDFLFIDEKNDRLIEEINLEEDFYDYINENIECDSDSYLYNLVPIINSSYVEKPYGNIIPKEKGLTYTGICVINHYGFDCLTKMLLEWIAVLEKLDGEYYYPDLIGLTEAELANMSVDELEELKEAYFVKSEVMKKLQTCVNYLTTFDSPDYVVHYQGI